MYKQLHACESTLRWRKFSSDRGRWAHREEKDDEVKVKGKVTLFTSVVASVTRMVSLEANGAPFTPLPLSVLRFTGIQSYGYTDKRKVETDVEVTEDRTEEFSLRKPRTCQRDRKGVV